MTNTDNSKDRQYKREPKTLTVKSVTNLSPNMRRVTFYGDALNSFPPHSEGAVIKLMFAHPEMDKPPMRTYTLSEQRTAPNEIDIDFMLHSLSSDNPDDYTNNNVNNNANKNHHIDNGTSHGIAVPWVLKTKAGDSLTFFGPGPVRFINLDADCFLLAADMTALPALKANLKSLPDTAKGKAFIEILSEADKQQLAKPANIELIWVINDDPGSESLPLFHEIKQADWPHGRIAVWVACEYKTMKQINRYLKSDRVIEKSHLYTSSYWKKGNNEEQHKALRKADKEKRG